MNELPEHQDACEPVVSPSRVGERIKPTDMVEASAALRAARRQRGEALASLAGGLLSVAELLELAASDGGVALRRIRISAVLAELGCTRRQVDVLLDIFRRLAHVDTGTQDRRLTIGWICDRRASGRRQSGLCEILVQLAGEHGARAAPADRYPYQSVAAPARRR